MLSLFRVILPDMPLYPSHVLSLSLSSPTRFLAFQASLRALCLPLATKTFGKKMPVVLRAAR